MVLLMVLPIFAFSGGPYMNYDLIGDGTYFAKAIYGDTSLKTQNEISDNIRVHISKLCGADPASTIFVKNKELLTHEETAAISSALAEYMKEPRG